MVKQNKISRRGFLAGASAVAIGAVIPASAARESYLHRVARDWGAAGLEWGEQYNGLGYAAANRRYELMRYAFSVPGREITRVWVDELAGE